MATKININDAAEVVKTAEHDGLVAILAKLDALDADLEAIAATLPASLNMDACRIIADVRGYFGYRRTSEIPGLLTRYETVPAVPVPTS